jgi:hypothetical protein
MWISGSAAGKFLVYIAREINSPPAGMEDPVGHGCFSDDVFSHPLFGWNFGQVIGLDQFPERIRQCLPLLGG